MFSGDTALLVLSNANYTTFLSLEHWAMQRRVQKCMFFCDPCEVQKHCASIRTPKMAKIPCQISRF